jgi:hypothetical protein
MIPVRKHKGDNSYDFYSCMECGKMWQINQLYIDSYKQEDKYFYEGMIEGLEHVRATL